MRRLVLALVLSILPGCGSGAKTVDAKAGNGVGSGSKAADDGDGSVEEKGSGSTARPAAGSGSGSGGPVAAGSPTTPAPSPNSPAVPDAQTAPKNVCSQLVPLDGTAQDASAVLAACVAATPDGALLELPAGRYTIAARLDLTRPMTITTAARLGTSACGGTDAHGCAELIAAPTLVTPYGLLLVSGPKIVIDHLVLNGNLPARAQALAECHTGDPVRRTAGFNARMIACPDCAFVSSTSKLAPCGTGLEVAGVNERINVSDSDFVRNGLHAVAQGWADGLTVHDVSGGRFVGNRFHDNTDVDLIFGGCQNCVIERNTVTHGGSYEMGAFAAIMIQAFGLTTSGRYDGSVIRDNVVDCGAKAACGYGLYVGSRAWYEASRIVNGTVVGNVVSNTQGGILIGADVTGTAIGDNDAGPTNGQIRCNTQVESLRRYHALAFETGTGASFVGTRVPKSSYVEVLYAVGSIPNSAPGCQP